MLISEKNERFYENERKHEAQRSTSLLRDGWPPTDSGRSSRTVVLHLHPSRSVNQPACLPLIRLLFKPTSFVGYLFFTPLYFLAVSSSWEPFRHSWVPLYFLWFSSFLRFFVSSNLIFSSSFVNAWNTYGDSMIWMRARWLQCAHTAWFQAKFIAKQNSKIITTENFREHFSCMLRPLYKMGPAVSPLCSLISRLLTKRMTIPLSFC